jgi:hypothetical protein
MGRPVVFVCVICHCPPSSCNPEGGVVLGGRLRLVEMLFNHLLVNRCETEMAVPAPSFHALGRTRRWDSLDTSLLRLIVQGPRVRMLELKCCVRLFKFMDRTFSRSITKSTPQFPMLEKVGGAYPYQQSKRTSPTL